jgi:hypothetical protein
MINLKYLFNIRHCKYLEINNLIYSCLSILLKIFYRIIYGIVEKGVLALEFLIYNRNDQYLMAELLSMYL